jgi:hypothetical protein
VTPGPVAGSLLRLLAGGSGAVPAVLQSAKAVLQIDDLGAQPVGAVVLVVEDADQIVLAQSGEAVRGRVRPHLDDDRESEQQRQHADNGGRGVAPVQSPYGRRRR